MARKILSRRKINPLEPVFTGIKQLENISLQLFRYNKKEFFEDVNYTEKEFNGFSDDDNFYWLNIHGIHDVERITNICNKLGTHNLAIQDILDINQRPKFQEYDDYWFFSMKSVLPSDKLEIETEQLSFILGKNFLVSFQERVADYFDHIRHRIRNDIGILRERGTDYLLFLLLEAILDNYFTTVKSIESKLDELGLIDVNSDPSPSILNTIDLYKRQTHQIKKTIIPIKEFVAKIEREEFNLVSQNHVKYYYELKDLCLTLLDDCDKIEVRLDSNINLFFSVQGHRMNQVMKTLTVVATIFIPLTFIAGIYGMNFSYMPELSWKWGYFGIWFLIVLVLAGMLIYFRRKKWF